MGRRRVTVEQMAAQGRRWFAKPPAGFEVPPPAALISVIAETKHFFSSRAGAALEDSLARADPTEQTIRLTYSYVLQNWLKQNGPTIFVAPDILEACEQTDVLDCIQGSDLKVVYPVGYFSLPKGMGFKSRQTGDSIRHIWFAFFESDKPFPVWLNGVPKPILKVPGRRLFMQAYWEQAPDCSSYALPLDMKDVTVKEALLETRGNFTFGKVFRADGSEQGVDMLKSEAEDLGLWMGSLCVNLCLIMQSYPQYVDKLSRGNSDRQHFTNQSLPQSLIITRATQGRLQQVVAERDSGPVSKSGQTRELKRRVGHWRRQPHGDRFELENPDVKIIVLDDGRHAHMKWIEPYLSPRLFESPTTVG